jgi:hypothetical protein
MDANFSFNLGNLSARVTNLFQSALNDFSSWVNSILGTFRGLVTRSKRQVSVHDLELGTDLHPVLRESRMKGMEEELRNLLKSYSDISDILTLQTIDYKAKLDLINSLSKMRARIRYLMWVLYHGEVHQFDGYHVNWMQLFPSGWTQDIDSTSTTTKPAIAKSKKKKSKRKNKKKGKKGKKSKKPKTTTVSKTLADNQLAIKATTPATFEAVVKDEVVVTDGSQAFSPADTEQTTQTQLAREYQTDENKVSKTFSPDI